MSIHTTSETLKLSQKPAKPYTNNAHGLYRFIRKDAVRNADEDILVIVAIGMMMSEFQPGHTRIHDIERMIKWAKDNTAVKTPTHILIVGVTTYDIKDEWNRNLIKTVELTGLPTTVVQLCGTRKKEDLMPRAIMSDATRLLKSDRSMEDIVKRLHLDTHPMQADLVTSDSSSPAPYIPVAGLKSEGQEFAPGSSLFVHHKKFSGTARSGGQYEVTNLWAFGRRWEKVGNTIEFTPPSELETKEGEKRMPLFRTGHGPASLRERIRPALPASSVLEDKRSTTTKPAPQAGGGSRDEPWTELAMTQDEYKEQLALARFLDNTHAHKS